jgi:hypothetical protein
MLQFVDTIAIQFPPSFKIDGTHIVQATNIDIANVSKSQDSLVFKMRKANPVSKATILVDGIVNPAIADTIRIVLTASWGTDVKFGPLTSEVRLKESIANQAITTSKIADRAVTTPKINSTLDLTKLFELKKLLFVDCKAKTLGTASSAKVINFGGIGGNGLTPTFGVGGAVCDAPGVEENDFVLLGPSYSGSNQGINVEQGRAGDGKIFIRFANEKQFTIPPGTGFWLPAIVFKKTCTPSINDLCLH